MKSYLNLGCGGRYHPAWTNIDIVPQGPDVIQHDLSRGIPLPNASCEVVYHAAVLEHIRRGEALSLLQECHRVLQPDGIIRVGVPDLERLCRLYLQKLEAALDGDRSAAHDYAWIMLELFDQTVREQTGGNMLAYLHQDPLPNERFVYAQIGEGGRELVQELRRQSESIQHAPATLPKLSFTKLSGRLRQLRKLPELVKDRLRLWLLGTDGIRALEIGRFRLSGEVHQWMYDRYSLAKLLKDAGFFNPVVQSAASSQIPAWDAYHLDTLPDGTVIKPDLFFMEAVKKG
ncbi:MAG: methyltransferase domain-containing protein [Chloroflexota bacterium]